MLPNVTSCHHVEVRNKNLLPFTIHQSFTIHWAPGPTSFSAIRAHARKTCPSVTDLRRDRSEIFGEQIGDVATRHGDAKRSQFSDGKIK